MTPTGDLVLVQDGRATDVLRGTLALRRLGAWRADLEVADAGVQSGPVTLATFDGAVRFEGTTKRAGDFLERSRCVVWGGAGGLAGEIPALFHQGPRLTPRHVLADILRACGEALSDASAGPELQADLAAWVRRRGRAAEELWRVADRFGLVARTMPDGTWFVGRETWREVPEFEHELLDDNPGTLTTTLGVDGFVPELLPGRYFGGRKLAGVTYSIDGGAVRVVLQGWRGPGGGDAVESQRAAIQTTVAVGPDAALYPARVEAQHADGSLDLAPQPDLAPEARTLPGLVAVPMRAIAPGVTATVPVGAVVLLGFEGGRADRPVALLWDAAAANFTTLKLGAAASKGAARVDDPVRRAPAMATWMANVESALTASGHAVLPYAGGPLGAVDAGSTKVTIE